MRPKPQNGGRQRAEIQGDPLRATLQTDISRFKHKQILIPMRWNACKKYDNPLVIMTSNLTLDQHIAKRYADSPDLYTVASQNLGARITNVSVSTPLFFMQKLLVPEPSP